MKLNRQAKQKQNDQLLGRLSSVLRPVISRYNDLPEDVQYDFRVTQETSTNGIIISLKLIVLLIKSY